MNNNSDSLIRDLDMLGVQEEVDLVFIRGNQYYGTSNSDKNKIKRSIFENEYNRCLEHNDTHPIKITSALVKYSFFDTLQYKEDNKDHKYYYSDCIELAFNNKIPVRLTFDNLYTDDNPKKEFRLSQVNMGLIVYNQEKLKTVLSFFDNGAKSIEDHIKFYDGKSIIDSFFILLEDNFISNPLIADILITYPKREFSEVIPTEI